MASRRNRPTLYEVVHRSRREPLRRPTPVVKAPQPEVAPAPPPTNASISDAGGPAAAPTAATVATNPTVGSVAPAMKLQNGNLYVRLGLPGLALGGLAVIALLAAAYQAGRNTGLIAVGVDPRDDLHSLAAAPPGEGPVAEPPIRGPAAPPPVTTPVGGRPLPDPPLATNTGAPAPPRPAAPSAAQQPSPAPTVPAFELVAGRTYVKIQHFPLSRDVDARAAQAYFAENGVATELMVDRREIRLFSREDFEDRRAAQKLRETILRLGKTYKGGYDFQGAEIYVKAAG